MSRLFGVRTETWFPVDLRRPHMLRVRSGARVGRLGSLVFPVGLWRATHAASAIRRGVPHPDKLGSLMAGTRVARQVAHRKC